MFSKESKTSPKKNRVIRGSRNEVIQRMNILKSTGHIKALKLANEEREQQFTELKQSLVHHRPKLPIRNRRNQQGSLLTHGSMKFKSQFMIAEGMSTMEQVPLIPLSQSFNKRQEDMPTSSIPAITNTTSQNVLPHNSIDEQSSTLQLLKKREQLQSNQRSQH